MTWMTRPSEIARLLNPAFCGEVLRRTISKYETTGGQGLPYSLAFLVLPIVLHRETRTKLPRRIRNLHPWLQSHQEVKIDFARRARSLVLYTKEAICFLLIAGIVRITDDARIILNPDASVKPSSSSDEEIQDVYAKAETLGRVFCHAGTPATLFSMWGVMP